MLFALLICATCVNGANAQEKNTAQALFNLRCQSAGERISRTVKDVDAVQILKMRPRELNYGQQFLLDDPYGRDYRGERYIKSFLRADHKLYGYISKVEGRPVKPKKNFGYTYVEATDQKDGVRYRYTAFIDQPGLVDPKYSRSVVRVVLRSTPTTGQAPRYGVTYDDISTAEDRRNWIAGSSLKVIDLLKNEIIAERIGYMMDPGQGNDSAGRSPWLIAASHACPEFGSRHATQYQIGQIIRFVEKVLQPRSESK